MKINKNNSEDFIIDLVKEVKDDFVLRQQNRKPFEAQWQLNMNFVIGNQYCAISGQNEVEDYGKQYFWQEREVFNHISQLIEIRMSKLSSVRPKMSVVPASADIKDISIAKVSKDIINSLNQKLNLSSLITEATHWSEICGTSFYKISWDKLSGRKIGVNEKGKSIFEGEVEISVVPPFEIFPESNSCSKICDNRSIIHARAYSTAEVKNIWGVDVIGGDVSIYSLDNISTVGGLGYSASTTKVIDEIKKDSVIVIERYEAPSFDYPNGRLTIVAGDKLLYLGELPYINQDNNLRGFPFVKQTAIEVSGSFWGVSVVERTIPVQRAYNAIKNRKHEFINRLSMGVLTVEDGSVDTENLEEEGLSPGKILIYRQGSNPPQLMSSARVPVDFSYEEESLLNEFSSISGVSELLTNINKFSSNISGVALERLIEQDESRLSCTIDSIKRAIKNIAKQCLKLYKQFTTISRTNKIISEKGEVEQFYFSSSDISSEDVVFESEAEITQSMSQRRSMIYDLLNVGLLNDENGKLSNTMRVKALEMLGLGMWDESKDIKTLQVKRAQTENLKFLTNKSFKCKVSEIDEHTLHIDEHVALMLSHEYEKVFESRPEIEKELIEHIHEHKKYLHAEKQINQNMEI